MISIWIIFNVVLDLLLINIFGLYTFIHSCLSNIRFLVIVYQEKWFVCRIKKCLSGKELTSCHIDCVHVCTVGNIVVDVVQM